MIKKIITIEHFLYILAVIIGVSFRFIDLGSLPLSDAEGLVSLHALQLISGESNFGHSDQTFLANIQAILFFFFGNSNFVARFFPALIGVLIIPTPGLFKKYFSPQAMIILSFWIALSPTFIALSRQVDSTILFLLSGLLFIFFLINRSVIPSAIFFTISLLTGRIFFWAVIIFLFTFIYLNLFLRNQKNRIYDQSIQLLKNFEWKKFGFISIITYFLVSTVGFLFPEQLSGVGYGFNAYLNGWSQPSTISLPDLLRGLFFYEYGAILFGIAGIIFMIRKDPIARLLLTGFLLFSIIQIILVSEKSIYYNLFIILPLMIAASFFIHQFATVSRMFLPKILAIIFITLSIIFFISLAFMSMFANPSQGGQENTLRIFFVIAGFALIIGAGLLTGWAISWKIAGKSFLFVAIIFLVILTFSAAVNASGLRNPYHNEILQLQPLPVEQDLLINTLEDYSEWNYGEKLTIKIFVMGDQPASLLWTLRNFKNVSLGNEVPLNEEIDAIITNADQNLVQSDSFRGQDILWTSKPAWSLMSSSEYAHWFLTRRALQDVINQKTIIVWVRNSLFPGTDSQ